MKNILKSKRAEGYIDAAVSILISMMLIVFSLNIFTFLLIKQDMDFFAKEMIYAATATGSTGEEAAERYSELSEETGIAPEVSWQADYFSETDRTVQYGDTISVTLTYKTKLHGFGLLSIPITMTAKYSGLSQKYWK